MKRMNRGRERRALEKILYNVTFVRNSMDDFRRWVWNNYRLSERRYECRLSKGKTRPVDGKWIRTPARFECLFNLRKDVRYKERRPVVVIIHEMTFSTEIKRVLLPRSLTSIFQRFAYLLEAAKSQLRTLITGTLSDKVLSRILCETLVHGDFYQSYDFAILLPCCRETCNRFAIWLRGTEKLI